MEYKDKITHLKEMWKQCSDREIRITDILRSEIKTLESELSQLGKMKEAKAEKLTIEILEIILEHHNGYSKEEIKDGDMGRESLYSDIGERIHEKLLKS